MLRATPLLHITLASSSTAAAAAAATALAATPAEAAVEAGLDMQGPKVWSSADSRSQATHDCDWSKFRAIASLRSTLQMFTIERLRPVDAISINTQKHDHTPRRKGVPVRTGIDRYVEVCCNLAQGPQVKFFPCCQWLKCNYWSPQLIIWSTNPGSMALTGVSY